MFMENYLTSEQSLTAAPLIPFIQTVGLWTQKCYTVFLNNDTRSITPELPPGVYKNILYLWQQHTFSV